MQYRCCQLHRVTKETLSLFLVLIVSSTLLSPTVSFLSYFPISVTDFYISYNTLANALTNTYTHHHCWRGNHSGRRMDVDIEALQNIQEVNFGGLP